MSAARHDAVTLFMGHEVHGWEQSSWLLQTTHYSHRRTGHQTGHSPANTMRHDTTHV